MMFSHQMKQGMTLADSNDENDDGGFGSTATAARNQAMQQARVWMPTSLGRALPPISSTSTTRRMPMDNKDLVIRMLAEIFQVKQDENGLVRWEQISTSLVPISLYSRTTSKWLDYLLAASSSAQTNDDPVSAMSPDSREFLLILKQFYKQAKPERRVDQKMYPTLANDSIVFQVVGHDYLNGQCKKILNVKIRQPGTHLGQASDYFVYWREQTGRLGTDGEKFYNSHAQEPSSSSCISNAPMKPSSTLRTTLLLNQPSPGLSLRYHSDRLMETSNTRHTWGLNFASINDARLFYDICSLNLVDLDFNSDYLKQVSAIETGQQKQSISCQRVPMASSLRQQHSHSSTGKPYRRNDLQRLIAQRQQYDERYYIPEQYQNIAESDSRTCGQCRTKSTEPRQLSKCSVCKNTKSPRTQTKVGNAPRGACPVHGAEQVSTMRVRSRSTTRQPTTSTKRESELFDRARSFSTPASPEHNNKCPVHQDQHRVETECEHQLMPLDQMERGPFQCGSSHCYGPRKPARGLLRSSQSGNNNSQAGTSILQEPFQMEAKAKLISLGSHIAKPMDEKSQSTVYSQGSQIHNQQDSFLKDHCDTTGADSKKRSKIFTNLGAQRNFSQQKTRKQNLSSNRSFHRVQGGADTFDCISRRDARQARARYANSKNMKEFLSLDVGAVQSATPPIQQLVQNRQFSKQWRIHDQNAITNGRGKSFNELKRAESVSASARSKLTDVECPTSGPKLLKSRHEPAALDEPRLAAPAQRLDLESQNELINQGVDGSNRCNVSTTTADLPLDTSTKRRMLKLTSDEILSERTEPKSVSAQSDNKDLASSSGTAVVAEGSPNGHANQEGKVERQVRAVSLGPRDAIPTGHNKLANRSARSDTSRRRSLERSMCIDMDSFTPISSLTKHARLSPLPQSVSSLLKVGQDPSISNLNDSRDADPNIPSIQDHHGGNVDEEMGHQEGDMVHHAMARFPMMGVESHEGDNESAKYHARQELKLTSDPHQLASFKSVPDVRYPSSVQCNRTGQTFLNRAQIASCLYDSGAMFYERNRQPDHQCDRDKFHDRDGLTEAHLSRFEPKHVKSNLSSYAVPLCTTIKSYPKQLNTARQCQSCPSSLRRKRRPISTAHLIDDCASKCFQTMPNCHCMQASCHSNKDPGILENLHTSGNFNWATGQEAVQSIAEQSGSNNQNCEVIHANLGYDQHCFCQRRVCYQQQQQQQQAGSIHRSHHHHCCRDGFGPDRGQLSTALAFDTQHLSQSFRSHSSQSNRSPMHYGLYESDCEHEMDQEELMGQHSEPPDQMNDRSRSACFKSVQPVQGYDQTMARATLKSRQRSKSQPPDNDECASNSVHLTKSMENVEKLIKEVQQELQTLKRQPLNIAQIEMITKTKSNPDQHNNHDDRPTKVSIDENKTITSAGYNNEGLKEAQAGTSATRKAGQFKCVGAVRKAGFLSVKKWILKRRKSIELARKQGWKRYWVCLRGTSLLFHSVVDDNSTDNIADNQIDLFSWIQTNCSNQMNSFANLLQAESGQEDISRDTFLNNISKVYIEKEPRHLIIMDGSIAQPIPEHPRRDFVFCLSTTFGDAYLFQASCQIELDNWLSAIHNACAASIARDLTRDEAIKLFVSKIRHFELEAEKKIFLRQRLESRLTSMTSMCNLSRNDMFDSDGMEECDGIDRDPKGKLSMRVLLYQLNQQLLALDTYIEQLQCEVYQLRCYLSSCSSISARYLREKQVDAPPVQAANISTNDLPHPKSLLMHVSKPTKLLLIKLGVFTVSSLHAYIHARQDSAESILKRIQQSSVNLKSCAHENDLLPELRIRSHSISEALMLKVDTAKLQDETEHLIQLANFKKVSIRVTKSLVRKVINRADDDNGDKYLRTITTNGYESSDDRYSIQDLDESICCRVKLNPNSTSACAIDQVLKILNPTIGALEFMSYYLRQVHVDEQPGSEPSYSAIKRGETLDIWSNCDYVELMEKVVFRVVMDRSRTDENEAAPFGISVEGQLYSTSNESLLNVYCSYIEWGSVADKAGLQDDDEFLMINGIPVNDLDLMFIECIIKEASKLRSVVRSNRQIPPSSAVRLDKATWRSLDRDGDPSGSNQHDKDDEWDLQRSHPDLGPTGGSQVISDEYLTSLVCPPPPSMSDAFLKSDINTIRQRSDLGMERAHRVGTKEAVYTNVNPSSSELASHQSVGNLFDTKEGAVTGEPKSREDLTSGEKKNKSSHVGSNLGKELLQRTDRLNQFLGRDSNGHVEMSKSLLNPNLSISSCDSKSDQTINERLQKSILELIETEYGYIRHLETINEHYMSPLEEIGFLNIGDLRAFSTIVHDILRVQHEFFDQLTLRICKICHLSNEKTCDSFERFNRIVQETDSLRALGDIVPMIDTIGQIFQSEGDKFKIYASYCASYSKLQKILHLRSSNMANSLLCPSTITSIPAALNIFSHSASSNSIGGLSFTTQLRELRLISLASSTSASTDQIIQLKQLTDFLGNLDSSSSSASFSSLAKSSDSELYKCQKKGKDAQNCSTHSSQISTSQTIPLGSYQKSVHQQNFESYLIKPIQRIVKYPMLLNSIGLAAQAHASEPAYQNLQAAIRQMETIANYVNDTQRVFDEYGIVFNHIERQYFNQQSIDANRVVVATLFGPHQPPITLDISQLLYFGPVEWLNIGEFSSKSKRNMDLSSMLFVFSSCVVFICREKVKTAKRILPARSSDHNFNQHHTTNYNPSLSSKVFPWSTSNNDHSTDIIRYQTLIPVGEVQVRSVPIDQQVKHSGASSRKSARVESVDDRATIRYQWELFQCSTYNSNSGLLTKISSKRGSTTGSKTDSGRVYLLSSGSNEERSLFLRKIRYIIRESVRNMSLPMARSPSSKSLTSKKLSTSSAASAISNTNINSSCSQATSLSPPLDMQAIASPPDDRQDGKGEIYAHQSRAKQIVEA